MKSLSAYGLNSATSCIVECKCSRADFLADKKKVFRRNPQAGMGVYRYYLSPKGLISPDELPEKWGLLEIDGRRTITKVEAQPFDIGMAMRAERDLIYSLMRRLILEDADLLNMAVDVGKLKVRLMNKSMQLRNRERELKKKKEARIRHRERQVEKYGKKTPFGTVLRRKTD